MPLLFVALSLRPSVPHTVGTGSRLDYKKTGRLIEEEQRSSSVTAFSGYASSSRLPSLLHAFLNSLIVCLAGVLVGCDGLLTLCGCVAEFFLGPALIYTFPTPLCAEA